MQPTAQSTAAFSLETIRTEQDLIPQMPVVRLNCRISSGGTHESQADLDSRSRLNRAVVTKLTVKMRSNIQVKAGARLGQRLHGAFVMM